MSVRLRNVIVHLLAPYLPRVIAEIIYQYDEFPTYILYRNKVWKVDLSTAGPDIALYRSLYVWDRGQPFLDKTETWFWRDTAYMHVNGVQFNPLRDVFVSSAV